MYDVGLIGYGAFGRAMTAWLQAYCTFTIYDVAQELDSVDAVLDKQIVILNIPAQHLEAFFVTHQALLSADTLYIDVCSVKVHPVRLMRQYLPETARIIATHPLFGPASASAGVAGQKIMVAPIRIDQDSYAQFKHFLTILGLRIIETTPEAHDHAMAYAQGLSHYIGRIMKEMDVPDTDLATRAYEDLLDMKTIQGGDSDALYSSIIHDNPYTADVLQKFEAARNIVNARFSTGPAALNPEKK